MKKLYIKKGSDQEILMKLTHPKEHEITQASMIATVKKDPECSNVKIVNSETFTFECMDEIITYTLKD